MMRSPHAITDFEQRSPACERPEGPSDPTTHVLDPYACAKCRIILEAMARQDDTPYPVVDQAVAELGVASYTFLTFREVLDLCPPL